MINVQNLLFTYSGNAEPTLQGLDFTIAKGEIFGFLGPSGAGKSTTIKILIGILKNYQGQVTVLNRELRRINADYYESIGVAFEFPNLYSKFTALENLRFFSKLYKGPTTNPLDLLTMVGLETDQNTRIAEFSKGMKMRLNFCRSLLNNPDLLFLDEPTSGQDPVNLRKIKDIILEQKSKGTTVCITTHDMHVADSLCDRVAFIVDGKIALVDSPRALKLQHGSRMVRVEYRDKGSLKNKDYSLDSLATNQDFQNLLSSFPVETIHTQEATLEDIFIKTTGRKLQ
ncbi:MAG TPA: ABC transporter ATP-binding protein [bacterium]|nr:ABC transporter ATP-binding protein [bacterium]HPN43831.1 ABC transporter ATP-binding protein [bacterium]